jgi:hypothetical protein
MTDFRLIRKVENGGIFIPLQGFDNQEVEIELHIKPLNEKKIKTAKSIANDFFSKINHNTSVNFDELNPYEQ